MKSRAIVLMLCLAFSDVPLSAQAQARPGESCPTNAAKLAGPLTPTLPADAKPTSKQIAFELDIGSDGRVRGLQLDQSSGDGAVDLALRQTLAAASYEPAQTGCVAYSSGLRLAYALDTTGAAPSATPAIPKRNTNCVPYIHAFLSPPARDRKHTGTATVAVELDAAGTQSARPALRHGTGSTGLDSEALGIASTGQYGFMTPSSCTPQPFTYLLELTFQ